MPNQVESAAPIPDGSVQDKATSLRSKDERGEGGLFQEDPELRQNHATQARRVRCDRFGAREEAPDRPRAHAFGRARRRLGPDFGKV